MLAPLTLLLALGAPAAQPADPTPEDIAAAVRRALPLLEKGTAGHIEQRDCFACHHQAVPTLALTLARERGFTIDDDLLQASQGHVQDDLASAQDAYRRGSGQGGGATRAGYALWMLDLTGAPPDETTEAVAHYLLGRVEEADHWTSSSRRPPSEISPFTATYVSLRALERYATPEQQARLQERLPAIRGWLADTQPEDTEDHVFRLLALRAAGARMRTVHQAAEGLKSLQRDDGGWSQKPDMEPDAYATATALFALAHVGALTPEDPAYRRGLRWLLNHQQPDGSWHVASRSRPFQTYFESGFPHGPDQFISMAATAWSVAALAHALPAPNSGPTGGRD